VEGLGHQGYVVVLVSDRRTTRLVETSQKMEIHPRTKGRVDLFFCPVYKRIKLERKINFIKFVGIKIIVLSLIIHSHQNKIKMKDEQLEKLQNQVNELGSREVSRKLVNLRIHRILGIDMMDLPDTYELCNVVDELQELLDSKDYTIENIRSVLDTIDFEFIENMVLG
jgi:hypothetical protein